LQSHPFADPCVHNVDEVNICLDDICPRPKATKEKLPDRVKVFRQTLDGHFPHVPGGNLVQPPNVWKLVVIPVYSSIAHTKAFAADFSLNAAATFNQGRSGRVYLATVCYFIPVTSKNLQMSVSFQQLIIQRNRQ